MAQNAETTGYMIKEENKRKEERSQVRIVPRRRREVNRGSGKKERRERFARARRVCHASPFNRFLTTFFLKLPFVYDFNPVK